jgi:hypothetical protein
MAVSDRRGVNWTTVLLALIAAIAGAIPPTIIAYNSGTVVEAKVDGKMTEMQTLVKELAEAKATLAAQADETKRRGAAAAALIEEQQKASK